MATLPYIAPEALTAREAQTILDYFNGALTARAIGDRIEIAGEYDVGARVGQRILDRRAALGGAFTNVQQIADVPYVGPERFTEIVVVLTGRQPSSSSIPAEVQAELDALRAALAALQPAYRMTLTAAHSEVFLGQAVAVFATVVNVVTQRPQPGATLTVSTSWGTLQSSAGMAMQTGQAVVVRTDTNGRARLVLRSPVEEQLTTAQRTEIETALMLLDATAPSPEIARPGLEGLVRKYRIERNVRLRKAIDIHFRRARETLADAVARTDTMNTWRALQPVVTAHLHADGEETGAPAASVQLTTLLRLRVKDWLPAFYQIYRSMLEDEASLDDELERIRTRNADPAVLLDQLLAGVYSYVARERGVLGEAAGQAVTDRSIKRFVARGIAMLPADTQASILPGLRITAQNVRAAGLGSLGAVTQSREDVRTDVQTITAPLGDLTAFATQLDTVQTQLAQFEGGFTQFQSDLQTFNSSYATFSSNLTQFNSDYSVFEDNLPIIIGIGGLDPGIIGGIGVGGVGGIDPGPIGGIGVGGGFEPGPIGVGAGGIDPRPIVTPVGGVSRTPADDATRRAPEAGDDPAAGGASPDLQDGAPPRNPRTPRGGGTPPGRTG